MRFGFISKYRIHNRLMLKHYPPKGLNIKRRVNRVIRGYRRLVKRGLISI